MQADYNAQGRLTKSVSPGNGTTPSRTTTFQYAANGLDLTVLQEHAPTRVVTQGEINLNWTLVRGKIQVFRPRQQ